MNTCKKSIGHWLLCVMPVFAVTGALAQDIEWLSDASEFTLQCSGSAPGERTYKLRGKDGAMQIERVGRDLTSRGPAWALLFTDIGDEFEAGRPTKSMVQKSGPKEGLTSLAQGASFTGDFEWARGSQSTTRTHVVRVEEKKTIKTDAFGEQEVVVVSDTVTGRIHNMKMVTHYAPKLKTFVYRSFRNFNTRDQYECNLIRIKTE